MTFLTNNFFSNAIEGVMASQSFSATIVKISGSVQLTHLDNAR